MYPPGPRLPEMLMRPSNLSISRLVALIFTPMPVWKAPSMSSPTAAWLELTPRSPYPANKNGVMRDGYWPMRWPRTV